MKLQQTALWTNSELVASIHSLSDELKGFAQNGGDEQHWFDLHSDGVELALAESMLARLVDTIDQERMHVFNGD